MKCSFRWEKEAKTVGGERRQNGQPSNGSWPNEITGEFAKELPTGRVKIAQSAICRRL
jgi:hypothetical protein